MTMAAMAPYMAMGGLGLGIYGTLQQGRTEQDWYEYNALLDIQRAKEERVAAGYEAGLHRKAGRALLEEQKAGYAAAGVTERGTPSIVAERTAEEIEIDALAIERAGGQRARYAMSQAKLSKMRGRTARRASYWQAGSTLLGGGSQIYQTWWA